MAAIRGRIAARRRDHELALFGAWQAERFARTEKLQPLSHYLKPSDGARRTPRQAAIERLTVFRAIAASGVPMTIERVT